MATEPAVRVQVRRGVARPLRSGLANRNGLQLGSDNSSRLARRRYTRHGCHNRSYPWVKAREAGLEGASGPWSASDNGRGALANPGTHVRSDPALGDIPLAP